MTDVRALVLLAVGALVTLPVEAQIEGSWIGTLSVGVELRIVFHIERGDDGVLTATMDSPDQGAQGIPTSAVRFVDDSLRIEVAVAAGSYEGVYSAEEDAVSGMFNQGGQALALNLIRSEGVSEPERPQEPQPPFPYSSEEVSFEGGAEGVVLAGTLTVPDGEGPFPAVALVSGSGPQNRDEELMGHKPFHVLADYLSRHGVAVLRYDDRGIAGSTGDFAIATTVDFAADAAAALNNLRERPEVAAVGIIGHSEGGIVAPMIAADGKADFIVMLAGPGVTGEAIIYAQGEAIARASGASEEAIAATRLGQERIYVIIKAEADPEKAAEKLRLSLREALGDEVSDDVIEGQIRQANSPWFRHFIVYDPVPTLQKVTVPVLALLGSKDLQVLASQNLEPLEAALEGNSQAVVRVMENMNHLFQTADTGAPTEYARIEETMAPAVLELIGSWILENAGSK